MTSGSALSSNEVSSICSTSSMVKLKPGRASEKHSGQSMLQTAVHLDDARHACCWWSGQRPQS